MKNILILVAILASFIGHSQDTIKIKADAAFGIDLNGGNNPLYGGNAKINLSLKKGLWLFSANPSFSINYISSKDVIVLARREGYNVLSVERVLNKNWKIVGFSEASHSYIRKVNLRWNGGVGPGFSLKGKKTEFGISEAILAEGLDMQSPLAIDYFVLRSSTRIKLEVKGKVCSFYSITMVQPAIYTNQAAGINKDFICRSQNRLEFAVTKKMSVGSAITANFQSYPSYLNSNVMPLDWATSVFINLNLTK